MSLHAAGRGFLALALLSACNLDQSGIDPTPNTLNFPIAIELHQPDPSVPADTLFVANSNFDLRFNSGSLQAIDLAAVDTLIADCSECVLDRVTSTEDNRDGMHPIVSDEVGIGSHADGLALSRDQDRLYLPVRSRGDLSFIDFDPATGTFECDAAYRGSVAAGTPRHAAGDIRRCSADYEASGSGGVASERELELGGDPVAVATFSADGVAGEFILMPLRDGRVALFLDDGVNAPELIHIATGFPTNLVTITMQPGTNIGWMMVAGTNTLSRVALVVDPVDPLRSFLYDAGGLSIGSGGGSGGVDDGEDSRDIQFHPTVPESAFVLSRRPEAVVEVDLVRRGRTASDLGLRSVHEVGSGPSRLEIVELEGRTFVIASCFDAQRLFIIDADEAELISVMGGFSGPFELTVDPARGHLYLVDFPVSVIRVVDLNPLTMGGEPTLLATIGDASPVSSFP